MSPGSDDPLDLLLRALADPTRRLLLDRLRDAPGATLSALTQGLTASRQALSKHLAVLEESGLVVPVWRGREKHHYLDPAPLQALPRRWVTASAREDHAAQSRLRAALVAPTRARAVGASQPADPVASALEPAAAPTLDGQPVDDEAALALASEFLAQTLAAVQALLLHLPPRAGYAVPTSGGFSLAAQLWHLADIETLGWRPRFERVLAENRPRLPGVDGDRLAVEQRYQQRPWRAAAQRFVRERRHTLAALAHFNAGVLKRPVVFAGARTRVAAVLGAAVAHDREHRAEMFELWQAHRREMQTR